MLSQILLESAGNAGFNGDFSGRYSADDGASIIAQETAMELYEIFSDNFMPIEECEFRTVAATMEGAAPLSDAVMEGIADTIKEKAKAAFGKIKEMLQKLWAKVKEFFHNIKRFFDGIFMNATKFATTYEKDLKAKKLKGFTMELYEYDLDTITKRDVKAYKSSMDGIVNAANKEVDDLKGATLDKGIVKDYKKDLDDAYKDYIKTTYGDAGLKDDANLAELAWSVCRKGAKSENDKKTVDCSNISTFIKFLKDAPKQVGFINEMSTATDDAFKKAIKTVDKAEKGFAADNENKSAKLAAEICRYASSVLAKTQTAANTGTNAVKSAMTEKIKAYKQVCVKALSYKAAK